MPYFTFLHWFAVGIIGLLFVLSTILVLRNESEKSPFMTIVAIAFIAVLISALAIYALDKYTKVARLENVVHKKVLINESFSIAGQIRNIGDFTIGKCSLEVKVSNDSLEKNNDGSALFVPKSALDNLFKRDTQDINSLDTTKNFIIAENLHKGEMRNFTVFMRYPPSFAKPSIRYELSCH